jgi:hypothetical protein
MNFTKESIQDKIRTDVRWTIRTIEILFDRQTTDEQRYGQTYVRNGRGFNGRDSEIFTSFYHQIQKRKGVLNSGGQLMNYFTLLSEKQLEICQKHLPKYWGQVLEEIQNKGR